MRGGRGLPALLLGLFLPAGPGGGRAQDSFSRDFLPRALRVDYFHVGDAREERIVLEGLRLQGPWAGPREGLQDPLDLGRYRVEVRDPSSNRLLYSRGFDTIFGEYQTTRPAGEGRVRSFPGSVLLPAPRRKFAFLLLRRDPKGRLQPLFRALLDPNGREVRREKPGMGVRTFTFREAGPPSRCLDVAFLGEGYRADQEEKFRRDVERFAGYLLSQPPFSRHKDRINIRGAFRPSLEEGCDEPDKGVWRNTSLGATHCAFGLPRYCLVFDDRALQETAAAVPWDTLAVMVNKKRYGGGGIYGLYSLFASDGPDPDRVFLHEMGHSLAGLADEYYSAKTAYSDFYPPGIEPREPNITALPDPARLKWRDLVKPGVPIPTPWRKKEYEGLLARLRAEEAALARKAAAARGKERARLEARLAAMKADHRKALGDFLARSPWWNEIGAFQGAGYASEGFYRPSLHCLMFGFLPGERSYCKVCERALERRILYFLR